MQSAGLKTRASSPLVTIKQAVSDLHHVFDVNIDKVFCNDTINDSLPTFKNGITPLAQCAWIAHYLSQLSTMEDRLVQVRPMDTFQLSDKALEFLVKSLKDSFQLKQKKPTEVMHQFTTSNKIRKGRHQRASIGIGGHAGQGFIVNVQVVESQGRTTKLATKNSLSFIGRSIGSIKIVGRDDPMQAEIQRAQNVLEILQGLNNFEHDNPW
ncbi:hypothetical protein BDR05DRAFT_1005621, partial [Suillus weaverae]